MTDDQDSSATTATAIRGGPMIAIARSISVAALIAIAGIATSISPGHVRAAPPKQQADTLAGRVQPMELPPAASAVKALLDAEYLSPDEKADLRIRHGVWESADLATPARRARAALSSGRYHDAVFDEASVDAEDRAEAMLGRGELEVALKSLEGRESMRAARLRAEILWSMGRIAEIEPALAPAWDSLMNRKIDDADELASAVRAIAVLSRVRGPGAADADRADAQAAIDERAGDFKMLMSVLARAREELDRLSPDVLLAEAELLYDKDNGPEAIDALQRALELNPRRASAWVLFGRIAADNWDFDNAMAIAARLDDLALRFADEAGDEAKADAARDANARDIVPGAALFVPRSALGGAIAARVFLKQQDPDAAEAALSRALALAPTNRTLMALRAAVSAANFDEAATESHLAAFDAASPGSPIAHAEVGSVLSDLRQYADAEKHLQKAVSRAPVWSEPLIELGLLQVQAGRDAEALETLERVASLDPFNVQAANSLVLVREIRTYATVESEHFIIRHKPGIDEILAREMLPVMEENFIRVTGDGPGGIDHRPAHKTVIELYPNHQWFSVRITGIRRVHTIAAATGPVIAMERPMVGPGHSIGIYDWPRVLRHEYTHTVTLSRTRNRLPHWFTEASAVYLEDAPRDESRCELLVRALQTDTLLDFTEINAAFVRPKRPQDRGLAYAQGHWMYEYIVERFGPRAPLALMDRYARGQREPEAFQEEFGLSRERFFEQFKVWAREQARSWGMLPPEGMPTVLELIDREKQSRKMAGEPTGEPGSADEIEPTPELVSTWLEEFPSHPDLLRLAVGYELADRRGEPDPAMVPMLERLAEARPVAEMPHKMLARLHLASDDPARAIPHLEFLDEREQYSTTYALELSRLYTKDRQYARASAKAERAVRIAPFDAATRERAATASLQAGRLLDARRHVEAMIAIEPGRDIHTRRLDAINRKIAEGNAGAK